jgi:hypothetical protein
MSKFWRYLRLTWTVLCGVASVLLIVLWVRSYWRLDVGGLEAGGYVSLRGTVMCCFHCGPNFIQRLPKQFYTGGGPAEHWPGDQFEFSRWHVVGVSELRGALSVQAEYWLLVAMCVAFAAAPWLRWRFSLRTLLIVTTLLAVVLGLVVYTVSK